MADILIRMEMPKCCCVCPCFNDEYCYCQAADKDLGRILIDHRHPDCPLIELPSHGRLIDADALREYWLENGQNEYVYDTNAFLDSLDDAPTIIEASGGKV